MDTLDRTRALLKEYAIERSIVPRNERDLSPFEMWLMTKLMPAKELQDFAVENFSYETEYDGHVYNVCFFCGVDLHMEGHKENCLYIKTLGER